LLSTFALVVILYLLLFTHFGNTLAQPFIEQKLNSVLQTPITIETFSLNHNTLALDFHDSLNNTVQIQGKFSLITLTLHAFYQADLSHVGGLNTFHLPIKTSGVLNGGYGTMHVQGSVDIFEGNIQYRTQLSRFYPSDVHISLQKLNYQNLLQWLKYPHHSSTLLNGELDLHGLSRRNIKGDVTLRTHTKNFSPSEIVDDNTSFDFLSLFTDDQGKIQPFRLNITLNASVDELGILEQFAMIPLRGSAKLNTILQGDQDRFVLDAHSTLAKSSTHARVHWKRLRPSYVYMNMEHADANSLFHLFSQSSPIEGSVSMVAESTINQTTANLTVRNGITHPDIFKRVYHLTQPQSRFNTTLAADITPKAIHYRGTFASDLVHLNIDHTTTHEAMLYDLLKAIP
ncbi:MAG: hypothetical protein PHV62_06950, partial [Sulfuricurvum sp.]|nr:hypothetical protein [Sulfuricurvum sp.]